MARISYATYFKNIIPLYELSSKKKKRKSRCQWPEFWEWQIYLNLIHQIHLNKNLSSSNSVIVYGFWIICISVYERYILLIRSLWKSNLTIKGYLNYYAKYFIAWCIFKWIMKTTIHHQWDLVLASSNIIWKKIHIAMRKSIRNFILSY